MRSREVAKTDCRKKGVSLWEMNEGIVYEKKKSNIINKGQQPYKH